MRIFYSNDQGEHSVPSEFVMGSLRPAMDSPLRTRLILDELKASQLGDPEKPEVTLSHEVLSKVHRPDLLEFISHLHERWTSMYPGCEPFPEMGIAPGMRRIRSDSLRAQLAYYCFDTCTSVGPGTWKGVMASLAVSTASIDALAGGERITFGLSRPPGHHAGSDFYGGYCYLNNAAVAAQTWLDRTRSTCAVLDVDFHHGNGTQEIFYARDDVFFSSLHRSPEITYPFFSGYEDERGTGKGLGKNLNIPLSKEATWLDFERALVRALESISKFAPSALIVSLGVDTFREDPVGGLGLDFDDFELMGRQIATLGLPTSVVMEGGYALSAVGRCVSSFLKGLSGFTT